MAGLSQAIKTPVFCTCSAHESRNIKTQPLQSLYHYLSFRFKGILSINMSCEPLQTEVLSVATFLFQKSHNLLQNYYFGRFFKLRTRVVKSLSNDTSADIIIWVILLICMMGFLSRNQKSDRNGFKGVINALMP